MGLFSKTVELTEPILKDISSAIEKCQGQLGKLGPPQFKLKYLLKESEAERVGFARAGPGQTTVNPRAVVLTQLKVRLVDLTKVLDAQIRKESKRR